MLLEISIQSSADNAHDCTGSHHEEYWEFFDIAPEAIIQYSQKWASYICLPNCIVQFYQPCNLFFQKKKTDKMYYVC